MIIINNNEPKKIPFIQVQIGMVFRCDNRVCLRTEEDTKAHINAVALVSGRLLNFTNNMEVELLDTTLTIN